MSARPATRVAGWAAAGVLVAGVAGAGIAHAADPTPTATPSPGASAAPGGPAGSGGPAAGRGHRARGPAARPGLLGRRLMHGEVVVAGQDGTPTTVDVQRGTVTAVSASSITVRSGDGFTATYRISATTRVRFGTRGATAARIHTGDTATIRARRDGDTRTATAVTARR